MRCLYGARRPGRNNGRGVLGEVLTDYLNALADGANVRMIRAVMREQSLLFQQEGQKHLLFHVPGRLLADALLTGLGGGRSAPDCLVERNRTGLPKLDRFATLPGLCRVAAEVRCRCGGLSANR